MPWPQAILIGAPVAAVIIAAVSIYISTSRTAKAVRDAEEDYDRALTLQIDKLIKGISTRVIMCSSQDEVAREAASLVGDAVRTFEHHSVEKKATHPSSDSPATALAATDALDYRMQDFIAIYGSVALSEGEGEGALSYRTAIDAAMRRGIRIRRYVRLLQAPELKGRSEGIQKTYSHWLGRQYDELVVSPDAFLIDNIRAPQWGSATATLITNAGILEIKSGGSRAIAFYSHSQAAELRRSYREELYAARPENRPEYSKSRPEEMVQLSERIVAICESCGIDPKEVSSNLLASDRG